MMGHTQACEGEQVKLMKLNEMWHFVQKRINERVLLTSL